MANFTEHELTFKFPGLNGRYEGHVVNWDEHVPESVHLARDGEDFFGVISRAYDEYCAVSLGPIIFARNGEGRVLTAGEHLVGAEIDGVGGYVREAKSLEHIQFGLATDASAHTFTSTRASAQEQWSIQTRNYKSFSGAGDEHIAMFESAHGIVIPHAGVYSFDLQISLLLRSVARTLLTTILQVDNADGHIRSLVIDSTPMPSTTNIPWDVVQTGFTPPLDYELGDRISLDFSWHPVASGTGSRTGTMQIVDTLGVENFLEVDRFNFLDGSHGSVITDLGTGYQPGVAPAPLVEVFLW